MPTSNLWRAVRYFAVLDERTRAFVESAGDRWTWTVAVDARYVTSGEATNADAAMLAAERAAGVRE